MYRCRRLTQPQKLLGVLPRPSRTGVAAQFAGRVLQAAPSATEPMSIANGGPEAKGNPGFAASAAVSHTTRILRGKGGTRRSGEGSHRTERRPPSKGQPTFGGQAGTVLGPHGTAPPRRLRVRTRNAGGPWWRKPGSPPPRQRQAHQAPPPQTGNSRAPAAHDAATREATRQPHPTHRERGAPATDDDDDADDDAAAAKEVAVGTAGAGVPATRATAARTTAAGGAAETTEGATAATPRPTTTPTTLRGAPTARRTRVRPTEDARVAGPTTPGALDLAEDGPDAAAGAAAAAADRAPKRRRQPAAAARVTTPTTRAPKGPQAATTTRQLHRPGRGPRDGNPTRRNETTGPQTPTGRCGRPGWGRPNGRRAVPDRSPSHGDNSACRRGASDRVARTHSTPTGPEILLARSPRSPARPATTTTRTGGAGDPGATRRRAPRRRARANGGDDGAEAAEDPHHGTRGDTSTT